MNEKAISNVIGFVLILLISVSIGSLFILAGESVIVQNEELKDSEKLQEDFFTMSQEIFNSIGEDSSSRFSIGNSVSYPFFVSQLTPQYRFKSLDEDLSIQIRTDGSEGETLEHELNTSILSIKADYKEINDVVFYYDNSILVRETVNGRAILKEQDIVSDNIEIYQINSGLDRSFVSSDTFTVRSERGSDGPKELNLSDNYDSVIIDMPTLLTVSELESMDWEQTVTISDSDREDPDDPRVNYVEIEVSSNDIKVLNDEVKFS